MTIITRTPVNPNTKVALAEMSKKSNLEYFSFQDGVNVKEAWVMLLSLAVVTFAVIGGGAAGWLVAREVWFRPDLSTPFALLCGSIPGLLVGLFILDWLLTAGSASYEAGYNNETDKQATPPDGLIRAARNNELKRLTGGMRKLLHTLALNYAEINTLAIIPWYESPYFSRAEIEQVRKYMVLIGAAVRSADGVVSPTEWGRSQLPKWAANDFSDVIELAPASPTPTAGR